MLTALFAIPIIAYLAVLIGLFVYQRQLLYVPDTTPPELGELARLGVREVQLSTANGLSLLSWYLPPQQGRPVVLYFHGNGGNLAYRADRIARFAREGYGLLMVEYRGYGGNPGTPSEAGLFADAEAAAGFLREQGVAGARIVAYGESLGSAVAVYLAARQPIGALILEAPFTSVAAAAQHHYPFVPALWLVRDRFDSLSRIGDLRAPLLVLHGERDRVVPIRFGKALFAAAPEPKEGWFPAGAGHGDLARFGALNEAIRFIERYIRG